MIKVSTNNFYVGNKQPEKDARYLASFDCDISGIQEGHGGNAQDLRRTLAQTHEVYWREPKDPAKAYGAMDVPVVIKKSKDLRVLKTWGRQISKRAQKENIGMPRAATMVRFRYRGRTYTFINTHTNAAVQGRDPKRLHLSTKIKRVSEYIAGMIVLEAIIGMAKRRGDIVILVGDLNYQKRDNGGVWKFSPEALFNRNGMHFATKGIDYIAWTPPLVAKGHLKEVGTDKTGSDHPWLFLDLEVKRKA